MADRVVLPDGRSYTRNTNGVWTEDGRTWTVTAGSSLETVLDRIATLETDNQQLRAQLDSLRGRIRPGEMMRGVWAAPAGTATHGLGADNE